MSRRNSERGAGPAATALAERLEGTARAFRHLPPAGARYLTLLTGITPDGHFTVPFETVVAALRETFTRPGLTPRVFVYGTAVVMVLNVDGTEPALVPLRTDTRIEASAPACLANLVVCQAEGRSGEPFYFVLPSRAAAALLNAEPLVGGLPRIDLYARRAVYAGDYTLLGPGYHPAYRVLVHGPPVDPDLTPLPAGDRAIDRLPPHLRALLGGFCFASDADLVNYLGFLLTGLLVHLFVAAGKAVALVDGNQPGVGKSLLFRVLGLLLDGREPHLIHHTSNDEELAKRMCATLRPGTQSVLVIDNSREDAGASINSPALEANSMAPDISLRILSTSTNFVRPNDVLWAVTMNATRVSPDLMSRGLPVRLQYDGRVEEREFPGPDPIENARDNRLPILGELAGMVERWNAAGRPAGVRGHRCHVWAKMVGGVLAANGFTEFLANYEEAAADFDAGQDELAALFELAAGEPNAPMVFTNQVGGTPVTDLPNDTAARAWTAAQWAARLDRAGVRYTAGDAEVAAKKAIPAGRWLAARLKRPVPVTVQGRPAVAELRAVDLRSKQRKYVLAVRFTDPAYESASAEVPVERTTVMPPETDLSATPGGNGENW